MTALAKKIYEQAMTLKESERRKLGRDILASVEDGVEEEDEAEVSKAWNKEIGRRIAEIESGKEKGITREELNSRLRAKYKWIP